MTGAPPRSRTIAIVGGGWAGLAAAVSLARKGVPVTLFEAGREPGGRARSIKTGHWEIDNGQHILLGAYTETLALMETVSPGSTKRLFLRLPLTLNFPGRYQLALPRLPSPLHLAAGLLAARGLSLKTRWAVAGLMNAIRSPAHHVAADLTVEQWLGGQPREAIDCIWAPLCLSALNTPLNKASAEVFANVLRDALTGPQSHSDMLLPRTDLTRLFPSPAISWIRQRGGKVELGTRIVRVEPLDEGISLESSNRRWTFDKLILACAPYHAARLLTSIGNLAKTANKLATLRYQPIITAYLDYPESVRLPSPIIGLCDAAAHFAFDLGQTHGQAGRLAVVVSAEHPAPEGGRQGRIGHIHLALEKALGPLPQPVTWQLIEEKRATFECSSNLLRPDNQTEHPHVYLAGDYTRGPYPATLEGAVRSGVQCAQSAWSNL